MGLNEAAVAKYIREQEAHDRAIDKLSVKEYADPFRSNKSCFMILAMMNDKQTALHIATSRRLKWKVERPTISELHSKGELILCSLSQNSSV